MVVAALRADSFDDRVEALFRPPHGAMIALSPDGQRVAYTAPKGAALSIVIMDLAPPWSKRTVKVSPAPADTAASAAMQLRFLRWATAGRLVYAPTERVVPLPPVVDGKGRTMPNPDGPTVVSPIMVVDVDGKERGTLIDAQHFQETPADARKSLADFLRTTQELQATRDEPVRWRMPHLDILGFLPRERDQLILRTRGAYSMPGHHLVDIRTGSVREFGSDWPAPPGEPHIFDGFRLRIVGERKDAARPLIAWRDEELARVQIALEAKFPRRAVEILDWSETRSRVLVRVTGGSDPGRLFVWQRPEDLVQEILRRAPWLNAAKLHETRFFELTAPDGAPLSGYVTWPGKPRVAIPPLLVSFPSGFPGRAQPAFDPESHVLADLGYVVVRLNHRGVAGVRPQDLDRLRAAVDRVAVDDARAAIAWLATRHPSRPFDQKRIATLGRGFGGYLAVRALQLEPAVFRGGIALDAPLELLPWLRANGSGGASAPVKAVTDIPVALIDHAGADWKRMSVIEQVEALQKPVLLGVEPARHAAIDAGTDALCARLRSLGRVVERVELESGFAREEPASRVTVYRKIEDFLNLHLHGFAVKIGPTKEVE